MASRLIFAAIFIPLLLWMIISGGIPFLVMWEIIVAFMLYEFYTMLQKSGIQVFKKTGMALGMLLPLVYYISTFFTAIKHERFIYFFLVLCFFIIVARKILQNNPHNILKEVGFTLFGLIYIVLLFAFLLRMLLLPDGNLWALTTFLVVWATDSAAFFVGLSIGKHKLAPNISPKKSIEGAVGGLLGAIGAMILIQHWYLSNLHLSWGFVIGLGFCAGILGQLGDLTESAIKRDLDIKDSSTLLKGHGGFLDRFDSILFVAPLVYYFVRFFLLGN